YRYCKILLTIGGKRSMPLNLESATRRLFPCPVCGQGLETRETKKDKPYVVCDPCGMQLFVRNETGISRFERLVNSAEQRDIWKRLEELQQRYHKKCPKCGKEFWITPEIGRASCRERV